MHAFANGVTFVTASSETVTATDIADATITGLAAVVVNSATANHYSVSAPGSATAGTPFDIAVTALDPYNNVATGYLGTVHFDSSDLGSGSAVPADYTFVAGDSGVHWRSRRA